MKRSLVRFRNSAFRQFIRRHEKYMPLLFFIGGFIFDTLTLGRVDRLYDLVMLSLHMSSLTVVLYLYNRVEDGIYTGTRLERYQEYFPLAIQFFFGALSSAYVIYFARSVTMTKTVTFFIILIALLVANEFLKRRISNKYLQFGVYSFVSLTFFTFMIPVFVKQMNPTLFVISTAVSFGVTLFLIFLIFARSKSTRAEVNLPKLLGLVVAIYGTICLFYFLRLIPPVPLALDEGIVAHKIRTTERGYAVTYERDESYVFWRSHRIPFIHQPGQPVYVFSSIFAPTDLQKAVAHRWKWYNEETQTWEVQDEIGFEITGGRNDGYRGYTFKENLKLGDWRVEVVTEEELLLGIIDFKLIHDPQRQPQRMTEKIF